MERAAVVVSRRAKVVEFQDNGLAARCSGIARRDKPTDPVVDRRSRNSVIEVDVVIGGEVRIERDPEKAAFAEESTVRLTNGVLSNEPVLITRSCPPC
jgi:hypothetical protein